VFFQYFPHCIRVQLKEMKEPCQLMANVTILFDEVARPGRSVWRR